MSYRVELLRRARRYLLSLPKKDRRLVGDRLLRLSDALGPPIRKLTGRLEGQYRLRVGNHRILYAISDDVRVIQVTRTYPRPTVHDEAEREG